MRFLFQRALIAPIAAALCATACGRWTPPAPTAPSMFQHSPSSGATIGGIVNGGSTASSLLAASTSNITVTVVGTNISAAVSVSGKFMLREVPAGTIFLHFTGPGIDATVLVGAVADHDLLDLTLTVHGGSARIEARVHIAADDTTEIEGPVANMSGTCPTLTIKIGEWVLNLTTSSSGSCSSVRVGVKIKIHGRREGNVIIVIRVEVEGVDNDHHHDGDDDDDDEHEHSD